MITLSTHEALCYGTGLAFIGILIGMGIYHLWLWLAAHDAQDRLSRESEDRTELRQHCTREAARLEKVREQQALMGLAQKVRPIE